VDADELVRRDGEPGLVVVGLDDAERQLQLRQQRAALR
jgi:hypothetical protein